MNKMMMAVLCATLAGCWDTGDGERVGQVVKLNKQGLFCKTWEGEILKGGLSSGSGAVGGSFHFTVEDKNITLVDTLKQAQDSGAEVKLHYNMEAATLCRSDSNDHFVDRVTVVSTGLNVNRTMITEHPATGQEVQHSDTVVQLLQVQAELIKKLSEGK